MFPHLFLIFGTIVFSISIGGKCPWDKNNVKQRDNNTDSWSWAHLRASAQMPSGPADFPNS